MNQTKSSTSVLTLKYVSAAMTALLALAFIMMGVNRLFQFWFGDSFSGLFSAYPGYVGAVSIGLSAVAFSVLAFLLYRKVTRGVAAQLDYLDKPVYHFVTNAFFAALALVFVFEAVNLVSVLVSSLLLIGSGSDIGSLYLETFLPSLVNLVLIGVTGFMAYSIMKGKNKSTLMTIILMAVAGSVMLAVLITVPIKAHDKPSLPSSSSSYDFSDYERYFN